MVEAVKVDISDLKPLIRDLRHLDKKSGRRIARAMKGAAAVVLADAKANAGQVSKKVPGSIKISATQKRIEIKGGGRRAPIGAYLEFGSGGEFPPKATWRHPLFGNRKHWYTQHAHPYLTPARDNNMAAFSLALLNAVTEAITETGDS